MIKVSICVLKKKNKILISSRPKPKVFSGFYEFPGGKLERKEFLLDALRREILEELNIHINLSKVFHLKSYTVKRGNQRISLNFFLCTCWKGLIRKRENQKIQWVTISQINDFKMLISNKKFVKFLESSFNYFSSM